MKNNSINGNRHPYMRPEIWLEGFNTRQRKEKPLIDSFTDRVALGGHISPRERVLNVVHRIDGQWTKRSDTWRKENGYPE